MRQGAYIFGSESPRLSRAEAAFFDQVQPWGFILFKRNVETPDQLRGLTDDLRDAVGRNAPVLIDQEGGRVQRMQAPHWRQWLPPMDQVALAGDQAERSMWLRYRLIAAELRDVGIDVNCAPSGDIASADTHGFLRNRCYGSDPDLVGRVALAVADGLQAGGVMPVQKHIPGHGRAVLDSHLSVPKVDTDPARLHQTDFAAFARLNHLSMAMTAHVIYSKIDNLPATTSPRIISLIRNEIGFNGLLMTDDISMEALDGSVADRSRASIAAGCDLVLHCNGRHEEMQAVVEAAGEMTDRAQTRADAALAARPEVQPIDIVAAEAELCQLLKDRAIV